MATVPLVAAIFFSALFVNKVFGIHAVHSRFWKCKQRTNTNAQTRFERLQRYWFAGRNGSHVWSDRDVVNFDFGESEDSHIIELPIGSAWQTCEHTHLTKDMCLEIETLAGWWFIGSAQWGRPGPAPPEHVKEFLSFGRMGPPGDVAVARLTCPRRARQLEHVLASAVQDAELYFQLCSTPIWIRILYGLVAKTPGLKEWIVQRILWIQLRTIFFKNDVWQHRGTFEIFRWTYWLTEPLWVTRWNKWWRICISKERTRLSHLLGKYLLGMSSWYLEYEIARLSEIKEMDIKG